MPRVSVIIPAFNREHLIAETIESVLGQSFRDYEIIVVDDGSSDNTAKVLQQYGEKIRYAYQENAGAGSARNKGISIAKGQYLAFLDSDDAWLPDKLQTQMEIFERHPEVGLVFSDCYVLSSAGVTLDTHLRRATPFRGNAFEQLFLANFVATSTTVVPTKVLDQVGDFRLDYSISQDYDLWLRIARRFPIEYVDRPLVKYRVHAGGVSRRTDRLLQENLKITAEFLEQYPDLERLRNRKLGRIYYDVAFEYLSQGQLDQARKQLLNVVRTCHFAHKALAYYFLSFLGLESLERMRTAYKALRSANQA